MFYSRLKNQRPSTIDDGMSLVEKFYNFICECCEVDRITADNIQHVRKRIKELVFLSSYQKIANEIGIGKMYLRYLLGHLKKYPAPKQRAIIKAMYVLSENNNKKITLKEIANYIGTRRVSPAIAFSFLEKLGLIKCEKRSKLLYITVNRDLMKEFYDIENFEEKYSRRNRQRKYPRAKAKERIKQALEIIGVSSVKELNETHIPKINDLRRGDFLQRDIWISSNTLPGLKKRLLRLVEEVKKNKYRE